MPSDLEIIKQLEQEIGVKLRELEKIRWNSVGYQIDEYQCVIGLSLYDVGLKEFPQTILQLPHLTMLSVKTNQLSMLPTEIGQLPHLTKLNVNFNQLSTLPPGITQLTHLTYLYLNSNQLSTLPPEITQLTHLTQLDVSRNQLSTLPPEITQLSNLTQLDVSYNQLSTLPPEITQLTNLTQLDVSRNQLSTLPKEIIYLKHLKDLELKGNTLEQLPPEIVKQGKTAIFEYLRQQILGKEIEHNEAKLILVGQGDVGKTCLAKRLMFDSFQKEKSTEGIDIWEWNMTAPTPEQQNITLNVWDFGGQEIYHATHQFFLTKRSVYLLVWNARKSKDYDQLLKAEERGKRALDCYVTLDEVSVSSLLDGYERKADRMQDAGRSKELWQLAAEKLSRLEQRKIIETDESTKFQLEQQIAELIEERRRIEEQMDRVRSKRR